MAKNEKKIKAPIELVISFYDKKYGNELEHYINEKSMGVGVVCLAKGTADSNIADLFGFGMNDKDVLMLMTPTQHTMELIGGINAITGIETVDYGLTMVLSLSSATAPLISAVGATIDEESLRGKRMAKEDKVTSKDNNCLVVAIIKRGFSDYVVSAARDAGATGATIIYGRGTADVDKHIMGISLQPEREVVLILVNSIQLRKKVMREIVEKTTLMEDGKGLCFSLPVDAVYGLDRIREKNKK